MQNDFDMGPPTSGGVVTYPAGAAFGPRRMRDFEFVWMVEGEAQYRRDGQVYHAPAGSVLLCRPNAEDYFLWDTRRRACHGFFHFDLTAAPTSLPPIAAWPILRRPRESDLLLPLLRHILRFVGQSVTADSAAAMQRRFAMATALTAFVTGEMATDAPPREALPDAVERAFDFLRQTLEARPDAPISLNDMANAACVTPEHLCRLFKSATGCTPAKAARLARLDHAVGLLVRSNYGVAEIAALCGFTNPYHFSECFRAAFGRSPRELRAAVRAGTPPPLATLFREGSLTKRVSGARDRAPDRASDTSEERSL